MKNKLFALEVAVKFYEESRNLRMPLHLKNQFDRACSSIALNLSEGSAKPTANDRRKFYYIALGSLRECQTILRLFGRTESDLVMRADFLGACIYKLCLATR
jgi:four helix bundle protein